MKSSRDRKGKRKQRRRFNPEEERAILRIIADPDEIYRISSEMVISVETLRGWVRKYILQQQQQEENGDEPDEGEERRRKTSRPSNIDADIVPASSTSGKCTTPGPSASRAQLRLDIPTQSPLYDLLKMSEPSVASRQTGIIEPEPSTSKGTGAVYDPEPSTSRGTEVIHDLELSTSKGTGLVIDLRSSTSEGIEIYHDPEPSTSQESSESIDSGPVTFQTEALIEPRPFTRRGYREATQSAPLLEPTPMTYLERIAADWMDTDLECTESISKDVPATDEAHAKVLEKLDSPLKKRARRLDPPIYDDDECGLENNNYAVADANQFGRIPPTSVAECPKIPHQDPEEIISIADSDFATEGAVDDNPKITGEACPVLVCSLGPHLEPHPKSQYEEELPELPESLEHEETLPSLYDSPEHLLSPLPQSPEYELPPLPESPEHEEELPTFYVSPENKEEEALPQLPENGEELPSLPPESLEHQEELRKLPENEEFPPLPPESPEHEEELPSLPESSERSEDKLPEGTGGKPSASDDPRAAEPANEPEDSSSAMSIPEDNPPIEHGVGSGVAGPPCDSRYMLPTSGSYRPAEPSNKPSDLSLAMETPMSLSEETPPREISEGDSSSENKARITSDSGNIDDTDSLAGIENIEDVSLPPPEFPEAQDSSSSPLGHPSSSKSGDPGVRTRERQERPKRRRSHLEDDDDDASYIGRKRPSFTKELRKSLDDALGLLPYESDSSPTELDTPKGPSEESDPSSEEKDLRQEDKKDDIGRNC